MKKLGTLLLSGLAVLGLAACGQAASSDDTVVRLGVMDQDQRHWEHVVETLAEEGITLELVRFTDWVLPNVALAEGELDLNSFQTYSFKENFNEANNQNLVPIAETQIMHFGIYSSAISNLSELEVGASVSLPNDPTNGGRALLILQHAGLVEIDPAAGFMPSIEDITSNPYELTFTEVQAQMLPSTLPDVTLVLMNASIANDAGLNPHEDALFLEPLPLGEHSPFINVIAARPEDADRDVFQTVVAHFQTDEVAAIITEITSGASFPVWTLN